MLCILSEMYFSILRKRFMVYSSAELFKLLKSSAFIAAVIITVSLLGKFSKCSVHACD